MQSNATKKHKLIKDVQLVLKAIDEDDCCSKSQSTESTQRELRKRANLKKDDDDDANDVEIEKLEKKLTDAGISVQEVKRMSLDEKNQILLIFKESAKMYSEHGSCNIADDSLKVSSSLRSKVHGDSLDGSKANDTNTRTLDSGDTKEKSPIQVICSDDELTLPSPRKTLRKPLAKKLVESGNSDPLESTVLPHAQTLHIIQKSACVGDCDALTINDKELKTLKEPSATSVECLVPKFTLGKLNEPYVMLKRSYNYNIKVHSFPYSAPPGVDKKAHKKFMLEKLGQWSKMMAEQNMEFSKSLVDVDSTSKKSAVWFPVKLVKSEKCSQTDRRKMGKEPEAGIKEHTYSPKMISEPTAGIMEHFSPAKMTSEPAAGIKEHSDSTKMAKEPEAGIIEHMLPTKTFVRRLSGDMTFARALANNSPVDRESHNNTPIGQLGKASGRVLKSQKEAPKVCGKSKAAPKRKNSPTKPSKKGKKKNEASISPAPLKERLLTHFTDIFYNNSPLADPFEFSMCDDDFEDSNSHPLQLNTFKPHTYGTSSKGAFNMATRSEFLFDQAVRVECENKPCNASINSNREDDNCAKQSTLPRKRTASSENDQPDLRTYIHKLSDGNSPISSKAAKHGMKYKSNACVISQRKGRGKTKKGKTVILSDSESSQEEDNEAIVDSG